jgi:hypothetical protein
MNSFEDNGKFKENMRKEINDLESSLNHYNKKFEEKSDDDFFQSGDFKFLSEYITELESYTNLLNSYKELSLTPFEEVNIEKKIRIAKNSKESLNFLYLSLSSKNDNNSSENFSNYN